MSSTDHSPGMTKMELMQLHRLGATIASGHDVIPPDYQDEHPSPLDATVNKGDHRYAVLDLFGHLQTALAGETPDLEWRLQPDCYAHGTAPYMVADRRDEIDADPETIDLAIHLLKQHEYGASEGRGRGTTSASIAAGATYAAQKLRDDNPSQQAAGDVFGVAANTVSVRYTDVLLDAIDWEPPSTEGEDDA